MINETVLVWLGAFSEHWRSHKARPRDGWVAATVLEIGDDGAVKARRDDNPKMVAWVKAEHWKEYEGDD